MALVIKHTKVSTIPDGTDPSLVLPSDWNANHALTGVADVAQGGTGLSAVGPAGTVLTSNGTSMGWQPAGGSGTVTSVALSGGTTGLTVTGSPITSSGTMTLAGTLAIANGGTGQTTAGNAGQALISNGSGSSSWGTPGLASKAYDVMGGVANQILFQNALDSTHYIDAPTTGGTVLGWNGTSFAWVAGGGTTLTGRTDSATPFLTSLGTGALSVATGANNTSMGYQAGSQVSSGNNNTFIGYQCGDAISTGIGNTALGANTLGAASTAQYSIAIGLNAALAGNGSNNIIIGTNAGANAATNSNIFLGTNAGNSPTAATAGECIGIGSNSLSSQNSSVGTVAVGTETFSNLGVGGNNTAVGYYAGNAATGGNGLTLIGFNAGKLITTANYNTMVGSNAGAVVTGANNTFIGSSCGDQATTITGAVAIGVDALGGVATSTAVGTVAVGNNALLALTSGANNTAIGHQTGQALTTGTGNTMLGYNAGFTNIIGINNTSIGLNAGRLNTNSLNTFVGANAGATGTGGSNTIVRAVASSSLTTGFGNTLIGVGSGINLTSGNNNTIIGNFNLPLATSSNYVAIADGVGDLAVMFNDPGAMTFDGLNYGSPGQVLKSLGDSNQPVWQDPNLNIFQNVSATNGIAPDDAITFADASTGGFTLTLPSAIDNPGLSLTVKRIDTVGANVLTIASAGGNIEGLVTQTLGPGVSCIYASDGANWWELANG